MSICCVLQILAKDELGLKKTPGWWLEPIGWAKASISLVFHPCLGSSTNIASDVRVSRLE
ncbi:MAG: hypothetical protein M3530_00165 [Thermoproteota archaeon]|nr:hypothetical protein [Thermoproteota archaeon]